MEADFDQSTSIQISFSRQYYSHSTLRHMHAGKISNIWHGMYIQCVERITFLQTSVVYTCWVQYHQGRCLEQLVEMFSSVFGISVKHSQFHIIESSRDGLDP